MAIDIGSLLLGTVGGLIIGAIIVFALASIIFGKIREQLKHLLTVLYSRTSLMLIAVFDVVAAFDPTQTILGIALSIVTGVIVFLVEWGLHDKGQVKFIIKDIVKGAIAAVIIAIPTPIAGMFVAWFGLVGDKRKKGAKH